MLLFYLIPAFGIAPKTNLLIFIVIFAVIEMFWRRLLNRAMAFGEAPNKVLIIGDGSRSGGDQEDHRRKLRSSATRSKRRWTKKTAYASPQEIRTIARARRRQPHRHPAASSNMRPALVAVLYELFASGIVVTDLVSFYELIMRKVPLAGVQETWFLENIAQRVSFYDPLKRAAEFVGALVLGIILLPFEILIALLVALTSRGPVIYKQVRVGEKGKNSRSINSARCAWTRRKNGAQWAAKNDARTTPIGGILRASHLDELPQLWNIIRGDLSFVGPRPERPEFVAKLEAQIPYYEARLFIKPGVTGWAQIHHRADLTDEDVARKTAIRHLLSEKPLADPRLDDHSENDKIHFRKSGIKIDEDNRHRRSGIHRIAYRRRLHTSGPPRGRHRRPFERISQERQPESEILQGGHHRPCAMEKIFKKERPEAVNHHAAIAEVVRSVRDPIPTLTTNVLGTANVLLAFGHHGRGGARRKFIFSSTGGAMYGDPKRIPVNETTPADPLSPYGLSKKLARGDDRVLRKTIRIRLSSSSVTRTSSGRARIRAAKRVSSRSSATLMKAGKTPTIFGDGTKARDYVYVERCRCGEPCGAPAREKYDHEHRMRNDRHGPGNVRSDRRSDAVRRRAEICPLSRGRDLPDQPQCREGAKNARLETKSGYQKRRPPRPEQ